jgi:hypothetical protein
MSRTRLSSLVAVMIVMQLFMVVAEAHAFEPYESIPSSHDVVHQLSADFHSHDNHSDSDDHENGIDHVRHCSHHGCHCPLLLAGVSSHALISNLTSVKNRLSDHIPDAPLSTLFRPPIV